jgi:hypothetical protein
LTYIVFRLPPLKQVGRLSVTCRDGMRAPVLVILTGTEWIG